ncbi:hypothetical protein [Dinoroseobacter sp. S76]|uniref:hypothetical protein n=1 Tax=Dinoroseobacter sp. S76 TaxID=3415124 RepID=UPI003C7A7347
MRDPNLTILYFNKVLPNREIRYDIDTSVPRQAHQGSSGFVLLNTLIEEVIEERATALPQVAGRSLLPDVWATAAGRYAIARLESSKGQLVSPRLR